MRASHSGRLPTIDTHERSDLGLLLRRGAVAPHVGGEDRVAAFGELAGDADHVVAESERVVDEQHGRKGGCAGGGDEQPAHAGVTESVLDVAFDESGHVGIPP